MIAKSYRSILRVFLALVAIFLVSCGSPIAEVPPVYNPTQVEQIQRYQGVLQGIYDRFPELGAAIAEKNWVDVGTFIHGPLGEIRQKTSYVIQNILPKAKVKKATEIAKELFASLEAIDKAATANNLTAATKSYKVDLDYFDQFLQLLPNS